MHEAEPRARGLWPHHPICRSRASAICLSLVSPVCLLCTRGRLASRARGHSHTRDSNLFPCLPAPFPHCPGSFFPTLASPCTASHSPSWLLYLFSSFCFSVCTIPWGCDRGEGAGHVGITSVYVPHRPPPSWAPAPSSRPPPLVGVLSSLHSLDPTLSLQTAPRPHEAPSLCVVSSVCPAGWACPLPLPRLLLQAPEPGGAILPRSVICSPTWLTLFQRLVPLTPPLTLWCQSPASLKTAVLGRATGHSAGPALAVTFLLSSPSSREPQAPLRGLTQGVQFVLAPWLQAKKSGSPPGPQIPGQPLKGWLQEPDLGDQESLVPASPRKDSELGCWAPGSEHVGGLTTGGGK